MPQNCIRSGKNCKMYTIFTIFQVQMYLFYISKQNEIWTALWMEICIKVTIFNLLYNRGGHWNIEGDTEISTVLLTMADINPFTIMT